METVLVVGSTGNIGTAAVKGALNAGYKVLAIVRNSTSANKLFQNAGKEGITTVEADIMSDNGIQSVVEQVTAGKLPAFQHVYSTVGGLYEETALKNVTAKQMRDAMNQNFTPNLYAYIATIPYLLEQNNPSSTWTLCTGAQGDYGFRAVPAMTAGSLFSMAVSACRELHETNIRFNEVYLAFRVEIDSSAEKSASMKASDFAKNYQAILGNTSVRGCRVRVTNHEEVTKLNYAPKLDL
ncbi:NAD(P)-binding protein [Microthyrium microscopicum]|uniref:NAD(P)-binding protein n=1 Tax=Microthyrium microscopicum TaxID=703497 RepID=A0A6A6U7I3_9PEZI|nr:NAD(P)-binding protein [Microthyrium microscopicum]